MSRITDFFLSAPRSVVQYELLQITHPSFSKTYNIVRNNRKGLTVTLEDATTKVFDFVPTQIKSSGTRDDLESGLQVTFGDLGQILPKEIDRVDNADNYAVTPKCVYRTYRSDDLSQPLMGPYTFEIKSVSQDRSGATFQALAPGLNVSKTGEIYSLDRFPMLRGFL